MQKAIGQVNTILSEERFLIGFWSNSKLYLVYVSLDGCKCEFAETFSEQVGAEDMLFVSGQSHLLLTFQAVLRTKCITF